MGSKKLKQRGVRRVVKKTSAKSRSRKIRTKKKIQKRKQRISRNVKTRGITKRIAKAIVKRKRSSTRVRSIKLISREGEKTDILKYVLEFSKKYQVSPEKFLSDSSYFNYLFDWLKSKFLLLKRKKRFKIRISLTYVYTMNNIKQVSQYSQSIVKIKTIEQVKRVLQILLNAFVMDLEKYEIKGFEKIILVGSTVKGYK